MSQGQRNRGSGGAQPLPKPYDFVPLAPQVERKAPVGHHRYLHLSGTLRARLIPGRRCMSPPVCLPRVAIRVIR